jgi:ribonuclease R
MPDPMAAREAAKYEFPVPSREAVLQLLAERGELMAFEEVAAALGVSGERDLDAFARRLRAMERDGQLHRNRRGLYGLPRKMDMVRGRVVGHPDGFGFLVPDEGGDDLFLPPQAMRAVMHGDRVMARVTGVDQRGRREGAVVEVLERARTRLVGRYKVAQRVGFVAPEDRRITQDVLIPPGEEGGAREGQIVVAEITQPPTRRAPPAGRIVEVLGEHMAPGMEIEIAIRNHDIPHEWPVDVRREAEAFAPVVPPEAAQGRLDLRQVPLVTIDGEDARDFDDAVFCERDGKGFRLLVAIADVSYYVRSGMALEHEAADRGNSVYFPQHVIPMLPEELSNGLCSINPHVDRLCMVCEMHISPQGRIRNYKFHEGVMRSHARLTYTKVAAILVDGNEALRRDYAAIVPHLDSLYALFKILHAARVERGAVDFELPETRIAFDEHRKIKEIRPLQRNDAHRLIEECMLAANVCAAEFLKKHKVPAPYRIHEGPTPDKLSELREFLSELGLSLGGGESPEARHYAKLLKAVEKRPDWRLIQTVLLRSLSQAVYSPDNIGHFALGYPHYTHFTSPIRRYPDLVVHRAIRCLLRGQPCDMTPERMQEIGDHCSMTERRADEATRDVIRWLKAEFMMEHIGGEFDGVISGVTNFGIFVELTDIYIDGLVHITALGNDYFHYEQGKHRLLGERTRKVYRLGDKVKVKVVRVNLDEARIDFELAQVEPRGAVSERGRRVEGTGVRRGKRRRKRRR